jgi:IBR domain, a half RING-finger domain
MSSSDHEEVAKVDSPYHDRNLPLTFLGIKHTKWTKGELVEVIETLGGTASTNTTKIGLYEVVHQRYDPRKILQRTINMLEVIAQEAAGQNQGLQAQVRQAVEEATRERADLAREKRQAAKRREAARLSYEGISTHRAEQTPADRDQELAREVVADRAEEDDGPARRTRSSANHRGKVAPKRMAEGDHEGSSDVEIIKVVRTADREANVRDLEVGKGEDRRNRVRLPLLNGRVKRRKPNVDLENEISRPEQAATIFGTSTAIRDHAALGVGLKPLDHSAHAVPPSCQVCFDTLDPLLQFQVCVASQCTHAPEICLACWEQHIAAQAETKSWDSITCPHADCGGILDHADMQRFAPRDVFRRYDRYATNKTLENTANYRLCAHDGCGSGGFVEEERAPEYMTCADCQRYTCLGCNLVYHEGQTCEEHQAWLTDAPKRAEADKAEKARLQQLRRAEKKSATYLEKKAKICPNEQCGAVIQKTAGCDHMTCRQCRHQFCWVCLADFMQILRQGFHMHDEKCKYYAHGIPGH